jgi:predicted TPR repeat methyltransferase
VRPSRDGSGSAPARAGRAVAATHERTTPNVTSFDERAATWDDDPAKAERARQVADAIRAAVPLDPTTRLLEYGAGTGLVTQALRDAVGPVTLADSSAGMRDVMNRKITAGTLTGARVWNLDLTSDPVPDERFDLVVTVLTLHHIPDVAPVLAAFAELLDDGGHLCIADLEEEDGSYHGESFEGHRGFDVDALRAILDQAGFTEVRVDRCGEIDRHGRSYPLFLATGIRPAAGAGAAPAPAPPTS